MVQVQLPDAVAAALSAKAAAIGLTLQAYLETLAQSALPDSQAKPSLDELERLLDEEATSGPSPTGSFSRAEFYGA